MIGTAIYNSKVQIDICTKYQRELKDYHRKYVNKNLLKKGISQIIYD